MQIYNVIFHGPHSLSTNRKNVFEMQVQIKTSVLNFLYIALTRLLNLLVRTTDIYLYMFLWVWTWECCTSVRYKRTARYGLRTGNSSVRTDNEPPFVWFYILKFSILSPEIQEQCFNTYSFSVHWISYMKVQQENVGVVHKY